MNYMLAILVFICGIGLIFSKFIHRKPKSKKSKHVWDADMPTHTPEQKAFFKGQHHPYVDFQGRLIDMDEHLGDVVEGQ